jgi:hypothetical protein
MDDDCRHKHPGTPGCPGCADIARQANAAVVAGYLTEAQSDAVRERAYDLMASANDLIDTVDYDRHEDSVARYFVRLDLDKLRRQLDRLTKAIG